MSPRLLFLLTTLRMHTASSATATGSTLGWPQPQHGWAFDSR